MRHGWPAAAMDVVARAALHLAQHALRLVLHLARLILVRCRVGVWEGVGAEGARRGASERAMRERRRTEDRQTETSEGQFLGHKVDTSNALGRWVLLVWFMSGRGDNPHTAAQRPKVPR